MELLEDRTPCRLLAMFQHALYHPTAVWMCSKLSDVAGEGIDDELDMFGRDPLDGLLDDVIAVLIFDASQNIFLEFLHEGCLLIGQDVLKSLAWSVSGTRYLLILR